MAWADARPDVATWFVAVHDAAGAARHGVAFTAHRSRALPGFRLLRAERVDPAIDPPAMLRALRAIADLARRPLSRVLRVYVELFCRDAATRASLPAVLREIGFRPAAHLRSYRQTLLIDLAGDEEQIFARLHATGRRHIRAVARAPVEVRAVTDPGLAPRLEALMRETFERTGGRYLPEDWPAIVRLSAREPHLSRVAGLFRSDAPAPQSLLSFAWGRMHGDHADYTAGASTRLSDVRTPLGYGTIWDLVRWAKREGATYFDLGGITAGTHGSDDPLGGISDFKRYFGGAMVEVGEEWTLEPHPLAARLAGALSRVAR